MLLTKNSLKTICSGNFILTFCIVCIVVVSSLVIFAFAMGKQNTSLELIHQEMEGLLGGVSTCCDNCDDVNEYYSECYHTQVYPSDPDCFEHLFLCIYNSIETASCSPGLQNADGCDTNWYYPATYSWHQDLYGIYDECSWYNSDWSVFRKIYFGCDMGSLKMCDDYSYLKACDKAGEECGDEWLADTDIGLYKLECATCS